MIKEIKQGVYLSIGAIIAIFTFPANAQDKNIIMGNDYFSASSSVMMDRNKGVSYDSRDGLELPDLDGNAQLNILGHKKSINLKKNFSDDEAKKRANRIKNRKNFQKRKKAREEAKQKAAYNKAKKINEAKKKELATKQAKLNSLQQQKIAHEKQKRQNQVTQYKYSANGLNNPLLPSGLPRGLPNN